MYINEHANQTMLNLTLASPLVWGGQRHWGPWLTAMHSALTPQAAGVSQGLRHRLSIQLALEGQSLSKVQSPGLRHSLVTGSLTRPSGHTHWKLPGTFRHLGLLQTMFNTSLLNKGSWFYNIQFRDFSTNLKLTE